ncbi:MAG: hypothetical protein ACLPKB_26225 [Xanthobacteraceae bacterium]
MALAGATELIWHFAGYLRLPPEDITSGTVVLDGAASQAGFDDEATAGPLGRPHADAGPELIKNGGLQTAILDVPSLPYQGHVNAIGSSHPITPHQLHGTKLPPPPIKTAVPSGPADGGSADEQMSLHVTATYQGGDQDLIDVNQANLLVSDNQYNAPAEVFALNNDHAAKALASMLDKAQDAVPVDLQITDSTTAGLEQYVNARDSNQADTATHDAPYQVSVPSGGEVIFVNGTQSAESSDQVHLVTSTALTGVVDNVTAALDTGNAAPPALTGNGFADPHQTISVGSDAAVNQSVIENLAPSTAALMVFENYYNTQEIVQTNVVTELDKIGLGGGAGVGGGPSIAPNTIENIADFQNQPPATSTSGSGSIATEANWSVDVVNGSLLDIHSLVQTNYLVNNNVVYSTGSTGDSQIIAGSNVQANGSEYVNLSSYNLIIVEGNYHQDDMIYQTNVLLDKNTVGLTGSGAGASVTGGGNTVINDATIDELGNNTPQQMPTAAAALEASLNSQSPSIDLTNLAQLFGNINVLVITGDYYDINYISQTNVISNANVVMAGGSGAQTVSTGNDVAVNSAAIFDGGSVTSPYLGGTYYSDTMLIQSNIITDGTRITGHDPNHLASELVAFTGTTDAAQPAGGTPVATPIDWHHHHHDSMSSVLH